MRDLPGGAIKGAGTKPLARREFLRLGLCATAAPIFPRVVVAQSSADRRPGTWWSGRYPGAIDWRMAIPSPRPTRCYREPAG
jgi:hypothetical protein